MPSIEPLDRADLATLIALCAEALDLPEDAVEAEPVVTRLLDPPAGRPAVWLAGHSGGELVGTVLASVSGADPAIGHLDLLAVQPGSRGQGLGTALVRAAEQALAGLGVTEVRLAGNAPCYAWPGIDVRYTPAVCLAGRLGYQRYRTGCNMTAELAGGRLAGPAEQDEERRLRGEGIALRPAAPADLPILTGWVERTWNAAWAWEVTQSLHRDRAGCHVAWRDGLPVGFAAYGANRPSWFGPMGTDPSALGLGIGRVLLRRCLAEQHANGLAQAQISWAGPVGFYARAVGARIERVFWLYRRSLTGQD